MKVAIITEISYSICNYGNVFQAMALNKFLRCRYGYEVYTIILNKDRKTITSHGIFVVKEVKKLIHKKNSCTEISVISESKREKFLEFYEHYVPTIVFDNFDELINSNFDAFVVGADVVWHQEHSFINSLKFLNFGGEFRPIKVSYAASFGNEWIPRENKEKIRDCLNDFNGVSVREKSTVDFLKMIGVNDVKHVLDPVFLVDKSVWRTMESFSLLVDDDFDVVYLLTPRKYEIDYINMFVEMNNRKTIVITYNNNSFREFTLNDKCLIYNDCSPQEWIWLIDHAQTVFTDSFHALAFSVIFQKQFWVMDRNKMMNRIIDFLNYLEIKDRLISHDYSREVSCKPIEYEEINKRIELLKNESVRFLEDAINYGKNNRD